MLEGCGDYDAWTDTGYHARGGKCFYPSVDGLEAFYESYPNATIVLTTRSTDAWYTSLKQHYQGGLLRRMGACNATGFPSANASSAEWKGMYEQHQNRVRSFAKSRMTKIPPKALV